MMRIFLLKVSLIKKSKFLEKKKLTAAENVKFRLCKQVNMTKYVVGGTFYSKELKAYLLSHP